MKQQKEIAGGVLIKMYLGQNQEENNNTSRNTCENLHELYQNL